MGCFLQNFWRNKINCTLKKLKWRKEEFDKVGYGKHERE
jgi:hypothetical protein